MQEIKLIAAACVALGVAGCPVEEPAPPDPDEPLPPVSCDDEGAPISLTRTTADSGLVAPGWTQLCTLCPATSMTFESNDVGLLAAWLGEFTCAVAIPRDVPPAEASLEVEATVRQGTAGGAVTLDVPLGGRGENPASFFDETFRVPLTQRLPGIELGDGSDRELLVRVGPFDDEGGLAVTLGVTVDGGNDQDVCEPTVRLAAAGALDDRHFVVPLGSTDRLPVAVGAPVNAGVLQASLTSTGSALLNGSLLTRVDLAAWEADTGLAPDEQCGMFADSLGSEVCVPCSNPADGTAGLPACVTVVHEFELAPAAGTPLTDVDPEALPPECLET